MHGDHDIAFDYHSELSFLCGGERKKELGAEGPQCIKYTNEQKYCARGEILVDNFLLLEVGHGHDRSLHIYVELSLQQQAAQKAKGAVRQRKVIDLEVVHRQVFIAEVEGHADLHDGNVHARANAEEVLGPGVVAGDVGGDGDAKHARVKCHRLVCHVANDFDNGSTLFVCFILLIGRVRLLFLFKEYFSLLDHVIGNKLLGSLLSLLISALILVSFLWRRIRPE